MSTGLYAHLIVSEGTRRVPGEVIGRSLQPSGDIRKLSAT
jgi:hypothetical protein